MRKLLIFATVLVGLGLGLYFLVGTRASTGAERGERSAQVQRAGAVPRAESPEDVGARGTAEAGSTPGLAQLPSEEDGVLEVEVLAGERPVPGANARLYWRGPKDPNLGEVSWRLASTGTTDERGRVRLASKPGYYLVAVRAEGFAPVRREVVRPTGQALTLLRLTLEQGQGLVGRTVVKGSREPLPLVELVLTVHGRKRVLWQEAVAPAEERVYGASDTRGNFRLEGLASGEYRLEAHAPGHSRAVVESVMVPSKEPLTVALLPAGLIEGFVVDAQGLPAAGAEVQLGGKVPQSVTTGQGGGFSVEVEAGDYLVSARRGSEAGALASPISVSAGHTVKDVQVRLGQAAALEGSVVASSTGAPVAGARVDVSPFTRSGDSGRAVTDEAGRFVVEPLAPGSYDLVVSAPGFSTLPRRGLTVASGERFSVELSLTGTGAVEGQVRDGQGRPMPGVQVVAGDRWSPMTGDSAAESRTDAEGRYRLEALELGRRYISARREETSVGVSLPVQVKEGATARADFTLEELGMVEGRVLTSRGSVPTEPLEVEAFALEAAPPGPRGMSKAEVEVTGTFRMTLPPGGYHLILAASARRDLGARDMKEVQVKPGETARTELTWPGEESGAELRGLVVEPDGAASPGAFVTVSVPGRSRVLDSWGITDEQGRFSSRAPEGLEVASGDRLTVSARRGGRLGEVTGVEPDAREVIVKLQPGASLQGRVVRAKGQAPVRGFTLFVRPREREAGFFPPDENTFEFQGDRFELPEVSAEPLELVVRTADGAQGEALISPSPGQREVLEIIVAGAGSVRGRVMDGVTQAPLAEAYVFLDGAAAQRLEETTASDGLFKLEAVPPGEHPLVIMAGTSRKPERRTVTVAEGQVLDLGDIFLQPPK
jgi:hypothetical protein